MDKLCILRKEILNINWKFEEKVWEKLDKEKKCFSKLISKVLQR